MSTEPAAPSPSTAPFGTVCPAAKLCKDVDGIVDVKRRRGPRSGVFVLVLVHGAQTLFASGTRIDPWPAVAKRLWAESERLTRVRFEALPDRS